MANWIQGMMNACGGYVKVWDVVNEPISGKDSGDGYYDLVGQFAEQSRQLMQNQLLLAGPYGDLDYGCTAVADARNIS